MHHLQTQTMEKNPKRVLKKKKKAVFEEKREIKKNKNVSQWKWPCGDVILITQQSFRMIAALVLFQFVELTMYV